MVNMTPAETYINRVLDQLPRSTPQREQIATELRGHIAERTSSGQSDADVIRQLGDPLALAESYLSAVPLMSASFGRRAIAKIIDALTVLGVAIPMTWLFWLRLPEELAVFAILGAIVGTSTLFALYTIVAESRVGWTLGKHALGLRVVRESGARISLGQSFVRQLPMFLEVFAIDMLFALFTERHQRAFELLSKTRVVLADRQA
jgi:uncharacterized RDD family membrane protein YckC